MTNRWVIAGGGTGGHVTPALALAEELRARGEEALLIGTQRGIEGRMVPRAGFELATLDSRPLVGRSLSERLAAVAALLRSTLAARRLLGRCGARIVLSVGGYAALPVTLAAWTRRIPVALIEPNALPGLANRISSRFARRIFLAFERAVPRLPGAAERATIAGVPLRRDLVARLADSAGPRCPEAPFRIFVFGGSQGARQLNETVPEAVSGLPPGLVSVVHQTGEADRDAVAEAYRGAGVDAEVLAFEHEMADRYRWSDLVVCRAGALTVAELALAKRPALLVPLGHVGGGEQIENARALEAAGAARVLPSGQCNPESFRKLLEELLGAARDWPEMGMRAASLARPHAASAIVDCCADLVGEAAEHP